ncbi:hypothetical protein [Shewanella xiamenensis]|uniref:hypothetical protein n=1 Tax=Shewanella xiamenensis TaxID=332186 RepID=UPI00313D08B9
MSKKYQVIQQCSVFINQIIQIKYLLLYVLSVIIINLMFTVIPPIKLPDGSLWSFGSILAGFIFIFRDYAQRYSGNNVFIAMIIALFFSYFMASPYVAIASSLAFAVSEIIDWAIYSVTNRPFKQRVLLSSIISCPADSLVFLAVIDQLSLLSFTVMTLSKFLSLAFIRWIK